MHKNARSISLTKVINIFNVKSFHNLIMSHSTCYSDVTTNAHAYVLQNMFVFKIWSEHCAAQDSNKYL